MWSIIPLDLNLQKKKKSVKRNVWYIIMVWVQKWILRDSILQFSMAIEATITSFELKPDSRRDRPLERLNHEKGFSETFFSFFLFARTRRVSNRAMRVRCNQKSMTFIRNCTKLIVTKSIRWQISFYFNKNIGKTLKEKHIYRTWWKSFNFPS